MNINENYENIDNLTHLFMKMLCWHSPIDDTNHDANSISCSTKLILTKDLSPKKFFFCRRPCPCGLGLHRTFQPKGHHGTDTFF